MTTIAQVQQVALQGNRAQAAAGFQALWDQVGPDGRALHGVNIAHYLADIQDDPDAELMWDLLALEAADVANDATRRPLTSVRFGHPFT